MDNTPKYDVPWELISNSLTGALTVEENLQLQQWLLDPDNKVKYAQIQDLWENGFDDYKIYRDADENKAWKALSIKPDDPESKEIHRVMNKEQSTRKPYTLRNMVAIAAVVLGLVTIGIWLVMTGNNPVVYETLSDAGKRIILKDGSAITLKPFTKIEVAGDFNKTTRNLIMVSGEAYFEVVHHISKPFIVEMGETQIKDVGTSFTVRKGEKEINVAVTSGKVEFVKLATKETRALSAGKNVTFNVQNETFGEISEAKTLDFSGIVLNFDNTPLSDAIISIQKVYEKKIILADEHIANKKLTAQLNGMPYHTVIKVICKSLGLEYSMNDSIYVLKEKK